MMDPKPPSSEIPSHFTRIFTDGAYCNVGEVGGWGVYVQRPWVTKESGGFRNSWWFGWVRAKSSFEVELIAIEEALKRETKQHSIIVWTDSMSAVDVLNAPELPSPRPTRVHLFEHYQAIKEAANEHSVVRFAHVPGHAGFEGNVHADKLAREGLKEARETLCLPSSFKPRPKKKTPIQIDAEKRNREIRERRRMEEMDRRRAVLRIQGLHSPKG